MADLLFEIGTEELPASAVYGALEQIERLMREMLTKARLRHEEIWTLGTPRRLVVTVRGLADRADAQVIRKKGPPVARARAEDGSWTNAALGFARSQGIETDDLRIEEGPKGGYVVAVTETEGAEVEEVLPQVLSELLASLKFGRSMRWGGGEERFSRPVRWLVALLGDRVVEMEWAGLQASRVSVGHRYLSGGEVIVTRPRNYEHALSEAFVMADHRARLAAIVREAGKVCARADVVPVLDDAVLEEVVQLVEWPGVVLGRFDEGYLRLPREVLVHAMESHQRYFPVESADGSLASGFIAVHNGDPGMAGIIRKGHERVLAARLADAEFFYEEDLKKPLADRLTDLEHVVYQSELGNMAEKSARLSKMVERLCDELGAENGLHEEAVRAAMLAKCDLVTHMVTEFPDLQGTVGEIYARRTGESEGVARAIGEQYLPRRTADELPRTVAGALLSIAEKSDNLAASFGLGHVPTGSEDPYALRRQALGLILTLVEHGFAFSVSDLVKAAASHLESGAHGYAWSADSESAFAEFFRSRERALLTDRGHRYDVVEAALSLDWDAPVSLERRLAALERARERGLLAVLYTAFERCANISKGNPPGDVVRERFTEPAEGALLDALEMAGKAVAKAVSELDFSGALASLEAVAGPVNTLFDDVLIMAEDEAVRANRLTLLSRVAALFGRVADFRKLVWD